MNTGSGAVLGGIFPLAVPSQFRDTVPDIVGRAATPGMVYDPEAGGWLLLFTGWRNANLREVYVAEINKRMSLTGVRKILSSPPTRYAVNAIHDPWSDGFVLLTTEGGPLHIRHLNRQFQERASRRIVEGMQGESYTQEIKNPAPPFQRRNSCLTATK